MKVHLLLQLPDLSREDLSFNHLLFGSYPHSQLWCPKAAYAFSTEETAAGSGAAACVMVSAGAGGDVKVLLDHQVGR